MGECSKQFLRAFCPGQRGMCLRSAVNKYYPFEGIGVNWSSTLDPYRTRKRCVCGAL